MSPVDDVARYVIFHDLDTGLDDEDDLDDSMEVPFEDFGDNDDSFDVGDVVEDGGFDYHGKNFDAGDLMVSS
jgi:hypothetical protein